MILLGVDYGLRRVGLATSNAQHVEPVGVVKNDKHLLRIIEETSREYRADRIIIGLPESKIVGEIRNFGDQVGQATGLPVFFQDECLTSHDSVVKMIQSGRSKKYRREKEDAVAAALILQNYLESLPYIEE